MTRMLLLAGAATALSALATPAAAQQQPADWTGFYVGGHLGYAVNADDNDETLLFDTNLDGSFNDTVNTAAGANAFSPGFCGGRANTALAADGCDKDDNGVDYGIHAGYDFDLGSVVIGGLVEYGRSDIEDSATAFSTTPANYVFTREMKGTFGARARVGIDAGRFLPYVTGGLVRSRIKSSFSTTNGVNAFDLNQRSHTESGYRLGAGVDANFGQFTVGLLYLYTNVDDDGTEVAVTRGTAGATNPFILVNPNGTTFRRSNDSFEVHSFGVRAGFRF